MDAHTDAHSSQIRTHIFTDTTYTHLSPLILIFIRCTMADVLTVSPAFLVLNVSITRGLHKPGVYTVTGHDLKSAVNTLTSPTRCLFNLILPETLRCYQVR